MQDFRRVRAWQASRELTAMIYRSTAVFPREERYGLVAQMRRASISIGANIAEGCGRGSDADMLRFVQMSFGSSVELLHHAIISLDLGFLSEREYLELDAKLESVRKMIAGLMRQLRAPKQPRAES